MSSPKPPVEYLEYVRNLKDSGLFCDKLELAEFKTINGLPYTGLKAKEKILANECFLEIPRDLLLTTKKAFFSEV